MTGSWPAPPDGRTLEVRPASSWLQKTSLRSSSLRQTNTLALHHAADHLARRTLAPRIDNSQVDSHHLP